MILVGSSATLKRWKRTVCIKGSVAITKIDEIFFSGVETKRGKLISSIDLKQRRERGRMRGGVPLRIDKEGEAGAKRRYVAIMDVMIYI